MKWERGDRYVDRNRTNWLVPREVRNTHVGERDAPLGDVKHSSECTHFHVFEATSFLGQAIQCSVGIWVRNWFSAPLFVIRTNPCWKWANSRRIGGQSVGLTFFSISRTLPILPKNISPGYPTCAIYPPIRNEFPIESDWPVEYPFLRQIKIFFLQSSLKFPEY